MGVITISSENRVLRDAAEITEFLSKFGIWFRRFEGGDKLGDDATEEETLAAYDAPIRELKASGGYTTADVIDVMPETPGLEPMLAKFSREHWHSEDEVRFVVRG